jgi:tyrosinase
MRKSVREVTAQERTNYIDGVNCLRNNAGQFGSRWDDMIEAHLQAATISHGAPAFLPWHRLFLVGIERAMQECTGNPNVFIP